jgi:DNA polymerase
VPIFRKHVDDDRTGATAYVPARHALPVLRAAVQACHGCELYQHATQAVFGEGSPDARVVLVGEVPGDREDRTGHPFVGPAGALLDEALLAAGIARGEAYVTNAVQHFKYTLRGKRRLHSKPTRAEIEACKPWLTAELDALDPEALVLLGSTAAQALLGDAFRVTKSRGVAIPSAHAPFVLATVHPASVLRAPDDETRAEAKKAFFADLAVAGAWLAEKR